MTAPYSESAALYDRIYATKNYRAEADAIRALVPPTARTLLEVGCGTGRHLALLAEWFEAEGVDYSPDMLVRGAWIGQRPGNAP